MAKETPRADTVFVFEQPNPALPYLIDSSTIPPGDRGNAKLGRLTVLDLKYIVGLRDKNSKDVSANVKALTLDDIHSLGRCFAAHWGMDYPNRVYSCCCCG